MLTVAGSDVHGDLHTVQAIDVGELKAVRSISFAHRKVVKVPRALERAVISLLYCQRRALARASHH